MTSTLLVCCQTEDVCGQEFVFNLLAIKLYDVSSTLVALGIVNTFWFYLSKLLTLIFLALKSVGSFSCMSLYFFVTLCESISKPSYWHTLVLKRQIAKFKYHQWHSSHWLIFTYSYHFSRFNVIELYSDSLLLSCSPWIRDASRAFVSGNFTGGNCHYYFFVKPINYLMQVLMFDILWEYVEDQLFFF